MRILFNLILLTFCSPLFSQAKLDSLKNEGNSINDLIPEGWFILSQKSGDLNKDGIDDLAFVIQNTDTSNIEKDGYFEIDYNPRVLAVYFNSPKGRLTKIVESRNFILLQPEKTIEDPFEEFDITKEGNLKIGFHIWHSASWYTSNYSYLFKFKNNEFELIEYIEYDFHKTTLESVKHEIDFIKLKMTRTKENEVIEEETKEISVQKLETIRSLGEPLDKDLPKVYDNSLEQKSEYSTKRNVELEKIHSLKDRCDYVYLKGTNDKYSGAFISQVEHETIKTNFKNGLKHGEHVRLRNNGDTVAYAIYNEGKVLKEIHIHRDARKISNNDNIDVQESLTHNDSLKIEEIIKEFESDQVHGYSSFDCSLDWNSFTSDFGELKKIDIQNIEKIHKLGFGKQTLTINTIFQLEKGTFHSTIFLDTEDSTTSKRPITFTTFDSDHSGPEIDELITILQEKSLDDLVTFLPITSEMVTQMEDFMEMFEGIQSNHQFISASYTCAGTFKNYLVKVKTDDKVVNYILKITSDIYDGVKHIRFDLERKQYSEVHVDWGK